MWDSVTAPCVRSRRTGVFFVILGLCEFGFQASVLKKKPNHPTTAPVHRSTPSLHAPVNGCRLW